MYAQEVDTYIAELEKEKRIPLDQIRTLVHEVVPEVVESIKWRMPTFSLPGGGDIIHMAAFKKHIGLYPLPKAIEEFQEALAPYHTSKGAIQFPLGSALPLDVIERIIQFRLNVLLEKKH
ncbi:iron chaperone [Sphaerochaeta sp. S2]|uniref:iron chaperone n=1 Tax=Sphaerochaeta sp. S2 TaxID=2798868 RepID=UPI0018EA20C6|nr:DUF1801 domain-containing protein [Sphaerochaeta sp. S2]MBJ2355313.1 DUF1801 domain-containing protein [Sphaerochaeta sp. S2]